MTNDWYVELTRWNLLKVAFFSESAIRFLDLQIPKNYLELEI